MNQHSPRGASHTEYCLPSTKPNNCVQESWNELQNVFEGNCPENQSPGMVGGLGGLPPAYLQVRILINLYLKALIILQSMFFNGFDLKKGLLKKGH